MTLLPLPPSLTCQEVRDQRPEEAAERSLGRLLPASTAGLPSQGAGNGGGRARAFLSPSARRGWAPHSVGVSGTVTQRRAPGLGFPWLTHPGLAVPQPRQESFVKVSG